MHQDFPAGTLIAAVTLPLLLLVLLVQPHFTSLLQTVTQVSFAPFLSMAPILIVQISTASPLRLLPVRMAGLSALISLQARCLHVHAVTIRLIAMVIPLGSGPILVLSTSNLPSGKSFISNALLTMPSPHSSPQAPLLILIKNHHSCAQAPPNKTSYNLKTRFRLAAAHLSLIFTTNSPSAPHSPKPHVARDRQAQAPRLLLPAN